jgi:hypothetical protein
LYAYVTNPCREWPEREGRTSYTTIEAELRFNKCGPTMGC